MLRFTFYRLVLFLFLFSSSVMIAGPDGEEGFVDENEIQIGGPAGPGDVEIDENLYWLLLLGLFFAYKFFMRYQKSVASSK